MIKLTTLVFLAALAVALPVLAFAPDNSPADHPISIGYYDQDPDYLSNIVPLPQSDPAWSAFVREHSQWTGRANSLTGLIHRAWGGATFVGIPKDDNGASDLAFSFLNSYSDLL
jgi:hypothetical protein